MSETAKRATWREWVPNAGDPALLTRTEVLAKLERLGLNVPERTLRYWEATGILPAPTIEKPGLPGHYPWWIIDLIWLLRLRQVEGLPLEAIRDQLRYQAAFLSVTPLRHLYDVGWSDSPAIREFIKTVILTGHDPGEFAVSSPGEDLTTVISRHEPNLAGLIHTLAHVYGQRVGRSISSVGIYIEMAEGKSVVLPLADPLTPEQREKVSGYPDTNSEKSLSSLKNH
jgi:DNA-binding transcriptional MerR regulator